jgi:RNA polymerase sigma factor for flagellar operon FliA
MDDDRRDTDGAARVAGDGRLDTMQRILVAGAAGRVPQIARGLRKMLGGINQSDCESAGYEALVRAALRYDPASGVPFMAYAYQRVRGAMVDAARAVSPDRRRLARMIRLVEATASVTEAFVPLGGDPRTLAEKVEQAAAMIREVTTAVMLSRAVEPEEVEDPAQVDVETRLLDAETAGRLQAALARIEPEDRGMIEALYFGGQTMHGFAEASGIHVSTVSRRHARALRRLAVLLKESDR